jgi:dTDP-4-dehydrorhamnose 3,5-epimerase-like enzyme
MQTKLIKFKALGDDRGSLISLEQNSNIPFEIKRVYCIYGTKQDIRRGYHAHKQLKQVAICISGSCKFLLDDGKNKEHILLDTPEKGLIIENMIWHEMYDFSSDCVLIVFANEYYYESDYIRDYDNFLELSND